MPSRRSNKRTRSRSKKTSKRKSTRQSRLYAQYVKYVQQYPQYAEYIAQQYAQHAQWPQYAQYAQWPQYAYSASYAGYGGPLGYRLTGSVAGSSNKTVATGEKVVTEEKKPLDSIVLPSSVKEEAAPEKTIDDGTKKGGIALANAAVSMGKNAAVSMGKNATNTVRDAVSVLGNALFGSKSSSVPSLVADNDDDNNDFKSPLNAPSRSGSTSSLSSSRSASMAWVVAPPAPPAPPALPAPPAPPALPAPPAPLPSNVSQSTSDPIQLKQNILSEWSTLMKEYPFTTTTGAEMKLKISKEKLEEIFNKISGKYKIPNIQLTAGTVSVKDFVITNHLDSRKAWFNRRVVDAMVRAFVDASAEQKLLGTDGRLVKIEDVVSKFNQVYAQDKLIKKVTSGVDQLLTLQK